MVILRTGFLVICENHMLRNGNLGLKMRGGGGGGGGGGGSRAAHTQYAYIMEVYPLPGPLSIRVAREKTVSLNDKGFINAE